MNVPERCPAQTDCSRHIGETTFHQDDIRRIDGDICSGSDGDTDVGSRKCRSVVDAVAHHGYPAFFLQFTDDGFLAIRQNACHHFIHTGLFSDGPGGALVVSGQHHHMDAHIFQLLNGSGAVFLNHICHSDDTHEVAVLCKEKRSLTFL